MDRLDLIRLFIRVVENGSFSATAHEIGIGQPAISKHIAALEEKVGAELIKRSARAFCLTEAGQDFYESSLRLIEDFESATARASGSRATPRGLLRVMATSTFSRMHISPHLCQFLNQYTELSIELLTGNSPGSLIEDGVDLWIRHGELPDSAMIAKKIADVPYVTVATSDYLKKNGTPKVPADLAQHRLVTQVQQGITRDWLFRNGSENIKFQPRSSFRTNDAEQLLVGVLSHFGIANAPVCVFSKEIKSGQVQRVLSDFDQSQPLFAVRAGSKRLAAKVSVFIEFLESTLKGSS